LASSEEASAAAEPRSAFGTAIRSAASATASGSGDGEREIMNKDWRASVMLRINGSCMNRKPLSYHESGI
jgi:hypothetical protein